MPSPVVEVTIIESMAVVDVEVVAATGNVEKKEQETANVVAVEEPVINQTVRLARPAYFTSTDFTCSLACRSPPERRSLRIYQAPHPHAAPSVYDVIPPAIYAHTSPGLPPVQTSGRHRTRPCHWSPHS